MQLHRRMLPALNFKTSNSASGDFEATRKLEIAIHSSWIRDFTKKINAKEGDDSRFHTPPWTQVLEWQLICGVSTVGSSCGPKKLQAGQCPAGEARRHGKTRSDNNGLVAAAGPGTTGTLQDPPWQEKWFSQMSNPADARRSVSGQRASV